VYSTRAIFSMRDKSQGACQFLGPRECVALAGSEWSNEKGPGQCHALGAYPTIEMRDKSHPEARTVI